MKLTVSCSSYLQKTAGMCHITLDITSQALGVIEVLLYESSKITKAHFTFDVNYRHESLSYRGLCFHITVRFSIELFFKKAVFYRHSHTLV